jgi:thiol-disulfide isomerase/thioredoxin
LHIIAAARIAAVGLAFGLSACDVIAGNDSVPAAPPTSRFEAVAPKAPAADSLSGFCDVRANAGQGKPFHFPPVDTGAPDAPAASSFLWLNLWATWCKPCVEEMPMIAAWQKRLAAQGKLIDMRFVSVDEDAQTIAAFRAQHPGTPETLKLTNAAALAPYIAELGLDSGAGLPIHVFVEKGAHVRCVRAGAITDAHQPIVSAMLQ